MADVVVSACKIIVFILFISGFTSLNAIRYEPNWDSLDTRPLPTWYDSAKVGIFIHWGVFSVPSFRSEWFWWDWKGVKSNDCVAFMEANYRPGFKYADFAPKFTAEFFSPDEWANIFQASGAEYVVLTSKHHEGFTNWPSKYSFNWNAMDVGPTRDLVGELADSIRSAGSIRFGLYHSLFEWFHPLYLSDKANKFKTQDFVKDKTLPELYEIVNKYKPEVVWSDGDWEAPDTYWNSTHFIAWLYNDSPVKDTVVTNDRWGIGVLCKHGDFLTCSDRYNPGTLQKKKWENAMTIDKESWGFRRNAKLEDFLTIEEIIQTLVQTVRCDVDVGFETNTQECKNNRILHGCDEWTGKSQPNCCGGNLLINVGPTHDGRIAPLYEERLRQMGVWLKVNGEAIYSTHPWTYQNDTVTPGVWYTEKTNNSIRSVYAITLNWPSSNQLYLKLPNMDDTSGSVQMLGYNKPIKFTQDSSGVTIDLPVFDLRSVPCNWAWVFRLNGVKN